MGKSYYIVGSGIVGCVIARELAEKGHDIVLWEKRNHTGGNLYDYTDEHGIHVHKYGPHIFHTNSDRIWKYVNRFCDFQDYNLVCGSVIDGKCVPTSFDFYAIDVFFPEEATIIKEHIKGVYGEEDCASIIEMLDSTDEYVHKFAQFLYDKDYAPYTAKQWGITPEEVDREVLRRVPIRFSYGSKYFNDKYQGIPTAGYSDLTNNLLDHKRISVQTNTDAIDHISVKENRIFIDGGAEGTVIYTGAIDELFEYTHGELPYRSLSFEWRHESIDSYQDMPVVAYPQAESYTRITEYKKLPRQDVRGTTYAIEYPLPYRPGERNEPYYPVLTEESKSLYERYKEDANRIKNLICCGRLADFKYYNMDQAIERALDVVARCGI